MHFHVSVSEAGLPKRCHSLSQSHVVRIRHLLLKWTQPERLPSFRHCCIRLDRKVRNLSDLAPLLVH